MDSDAELDVEEDGEEEPNEIFDSTGLGEEEEKQEQADDEEGLRLDSPKFTPLPPPTASLIHHPSQPPQPPLLPLPQPFFFAPPSQPLQPPLPFFSFPPLPPPPPKHIRTLPVVSNKSSSSPRKVYQQGFFHFQIKLECESSLRVQERLWAQSLWLAAESAQCRDMKTYIETIYSDSVMASQIYARYRHVENSPKPLFDYAGKLFFFKSNHGFLLRLTRIPLERPDAESLANEIFLRIPDLAKRLACYPGVDNNLPGISDQCLLFSRPSKQAVPSTFREKMLIWVEEAQEWFKFNQIRRNLRFVLPERLFFSLKTTWFPNKQAIHKFQQDVKKRMKQYRHKEDRFSIESEPEEEDQDQDDNEEEEEEEEEEEKKKKKKRRKKKKKTTTTTTMSSSDMELQRKCQTEIEQERQQAKMLLENQLTLEQKQLLSQIMARIDYRYLVLQAHHHRLLQLQQQQQEQSSSSSSVSSQNPVRPAGSMTISLSPTIQVPPFYVSQVTNWILAKIETTTSSSPSLSSSNKLVFPPQAETWMSSSSNNKNILVHEPGLEPSFSSSTTIPVVVVPVLPVSARPDLPSPPGPRVHQIVDFSPLVTSSSSSSSSSSHAFITSEVTTQNKVITSPSPLPLPLPLPPLPPLPILPPPVVVRSLPYSVDKQALQSTTGIQDWNNFSQLNRLRMALFDMNQTKAKGEVEFQASLPPTVHEEIRKIMVENQSILLT